MYLDDWRWNKYLIYFHTFQLNVSLFLQAKLKLYLSFLPLMYFVVRSCIQLYKCRVICITQSQTRIHLSNSKEMNYKKCILFEKVALWAIKVRLLPNHSTFIIKNVKHEKSSSYHFPKSTCSRNVSFAFQK